MMRIDIYVPSSSSEATYLVSVDQDDQGGIYQMFLSGGSIWETV